MYSRKHIIEPKSIVETTGWKTGNVPKKHAPFYKAAFPLGSSFYWRSAKLTSHKDKREYHLLVSVRMDKPNYRAWLSMKTDEGYTLVARYESHINHGGPHVHYLCNQEAFPFGEIDPDGAISIPHWKRSKKKPFGVMSLSTAWNISLKFYRIGTSNIGDLGI